MHTKIQLQVGFGYYKLSNLAHELLLPIFKHTKIQIDVDTSNNETWSTNFCYQLSIHEHTK
jgi:hypothetical protein